MVSELLGSFSCNELSPECIFGAERAGFLKQDYVSVPCRYYASAQLVSTPKLWNLVRSVSLGAKRPDIHDVFEMGYVVKFHQAFMISNVEKAFEFRHGGDEAGAATAYAYCTAGGEEKSSQYRQLRFVSEADSVCHGLAGYFHADLWAAKRGDYTHLFTGGANQNVGAKQSAEADAAAKTAKAKQQEWEDITISIDPLTESKEMISWFPIYFPFRQPLHLKKGQEVLVDMWRKISGRGQGDKVWYEWAVKKPFTGQGVHNIGGRSYAMHM